MKTIINRSLSALICLIYLSSVLFVKSESDIVLVLKTVFSLIFILSLIWYGRLWSIITMGIFSHGSEINVESPPLLICIFGWVLLIGLPILFYLIDLSL